jgi:hypothetical protein
MFRRPTVAAALAAAVLVVAAGCTGSPEPVESTPAPLTEEEAFAAAEETYRAYVDALNQVDLADPETFEPVYALTTGDLNASDRENFSTWHAENMRITGTATVDEVAQVSYEADSVVIEACYNITDVDVLDSAGASIVEESRPPVQALQVHQVVGADAAFRISTISPAEDLSCAG